MLPKLLDVTVELGLLSWVWLMPLKNSARYRSLHRSLITNNRWIAKSKLNVPGPGRMLRPELSNVPGAAVLNDDVVNHWVIRCPSGPLVRDGLAITSARSLPTPLSASSSPAVIVNGNPLCQFQMPLV